MSLKERAQGYRLAETFIGDTIQKIAMRELGDAGRWPELVAYNGLVPPYVVDDLQGIEESGDAGVVLIAGMHIKVPASRPKNNVSDPRDIFGTDILLTEGNLTTTEEGDFALVRDLPNLNQALRILLNTQQGELIWHALYGNPLFKLIGQKADAVVKQFAAAQATRTLRSDPRVDSVASIEVDVQGDALPVDAVAVAIDGRPLPVRSDN